MAIHEPILPKIGDFPMMPKGPEEAKPAAPSGQLGHVKEKSWTPLGFLPGWAKWGINQTVKTTLILASHGAWHAAAIDGDLSDFHMPESNFFGNFREWLKGNWGPGDELAAVKGFGTTLNDMLVQPAKGEKNPSPFAATKSRHIIPRLRENENAMLGVLSPGNIVAKGWNFMAERAIPCTIYCAFFAASPAGIPGAIGTFMITSFMADAMEKILYKPLIAKPLGLA